MTTPRQTDRDTFINGVDWFARLSRAWRDITKIKGKKTSQVSRPYPLHGANELMNTWATTSRSASLPPEMQAKIKPKLNLETTSLTS